MNQQTCQVDFYHLTKSDLASNIALLADKIVGSQKTALILCAEVMADLISSALWETTADNFLAHGVADDEVNLNAPLWLVHDPDYNPISADYILITSGLEVSDIRKFARVFMVFDGTSEFEVSSARQKWKSWSQIDDVKCRYFSQDTAGKWTQNA